MFYHDSKLQYKVRVEKPNPIFAKQLQQAIHPIPNSFPQEQELQDVNYTFMSTTQNGKEPPKGRWSQGPSIDGRSTFESRRFSRCR